MLAVDLEGLEPPSSRVKTGDSATELQIQSPAEVPPWFHSRRGKAAPVVPRVSRRVVFRRSGGMEGVGRRPLDQSRVRYLLRHRSEADFVARLVLPLHGLLPFALGRARLSSASSPWNPNPACGERPGSCRKARACPREFQTPDATKAALVSQGGLLRHEGLSWLPPLGTLSKGENQFRSEDAAAPEMVFRKQVTALTRARCARAPVGERLVARIHRARSQSGSPRLGSF